MVGWTLKKNHIFYGSKFSFGSSVVRLVKMLIWASFFSNEDGFKSVDRKLLIFSDLL